MTSVEIMREVERVFQEFASRDFASLLRAYCDLQHRYGAALVDEAVLRNYQTVTAMVQFQTKRRW